MNRTPKAFLFFLRRSTRNRFIVLARRLRKPRYLVGFVLTILYFGWIFGRWSTPRGSQEGMGLEAYLWIGTGLTYLTMLLAWLFASERALNFRQSEVEILFPAPITRTGLLSFKFLQAQPGMLILAGLMTFGLSRFSTVSALFAFLIVYVVSNIFFAHGIFAALTRLAWKKRGGVWRLLSYGPALLLITIPVSAFLYAKHEVGSLATLEDWQRLAGSDAIQTVAWPIMAVLEGVLAPDVPSFVPSFLSAVGFLGVLFLLVLQADVAFEEAAVAAARTHTLIREKGLQAVRHEKKAASANRPLFSLAPHGSAWAAFTWKNLTSIARLDRRVWIVAVAILLPTVIFTFVAQRDAEEQAGWSVPTVILLSQVLTMVTLFAPSLIRVDLRLDILHFDMLKSFPVRGRDLIFGEVLATTLLIVAIQLALLVFGALFLNKVEDFVIGWDLKAPALLGGAATLASLTFLLVTVENLLALYLPSFTRLGRGYRKGIDQMGQQMLAAMIRVFLLMFMLLIPGTVGALVAFIVHTFLGVSAAILATGLIVGLLITTLALGLIALSEGRYERFDLSSESLHES